MKRLLPSDPILSVLLGLASIALAVRSIVFVCQNYFQILFWDQWNMVDDLVHDEAGTKSLAYLFKPHNEHIIATSKVLFALDQSLFHLTNLPLVLCTILFACLAAWLLTVLVFWSRQRSPLFWTVWLVFCASGLSLVQWENLLWGFQSQFYLVSIGALASIVIALKVARKESNNGIAWLAALQAAMGFCVFSMGNGIAIPVCVIAILLFYRASWSKILVTAGFGILFVATFLALRQSGGPQLAAPPKDLFSMTDFFLVMVGGAPFHEGVGVAAACGILLLIALIALFVRNFVYPAPGQDKDPGLAGLFALAAFLLASVAAAAWARSFFGADYALNSRYATPTLLLWMTLFAISVRLCLTARLFPANERFRGIALWLSIGAAFVAVALSTFVGASWNGLVGRSRDLRQAAYFAASGVFDPAEVSQFYYNPPKVAPLIDYLRNNQLNIFSPSMGLPKPSTEEIQKLTAVRSFPICIHGYVDDTHRIDDNSWKVSGWIADSDLHAPRFIVATDDSGRLAGFTAPLTYRPDVEVATGAKHFRGYLLPVLQTPGAPAPSFVAAIFQNGTTCRLLLPHPLP